METRTKAGQWTGGIALQGQALRKLKTCVCQQSSLFSAELHRSTSQAQSRKQRSPFSMDNGADVNGVAAPSPSWWQGHSL